MAAIKEATFEDEPEETKKKKRKNKKAKEPTVPEGDARSEPSESTTDKPAELTAENAPEPKTSDAKTDNEIPQEQQKTTPNKGKQPANKNKTTPKKSSDAAIDSVTDANKVKPEESSPKHSKVCFMYYSL